MNAWHSVSLTAVSTSSRKSLDWCLYYLKKKGAAVQHRARVEQLGWCESELEGRGLISLPSPHPRLARCRETAGKYLLNASECRLLEQADSFRPLMAHVKPKGHCFLLGNHILMPFSPGSGRQGHRNWWHGFLFLKWQIFGLKDLFSSRGQLGGTWVHRW